MYKNLEQRIFSSYLLQSAPEFSGRADNQTDGPDWKSLYNWTRSAYRLFAESPELLAPKLREDTTFPNTYSAEHEGRPKLKSEMRGSIKLMNRLLQIVWEAARAGTEENGYLLLPVEFAVNKKDTGKLGLTGIVFSDGKMTAERYPGMFKALKELSLRTDGFRPPWGKFVEISQGDAPAEAVLSTEGASVYANGYRRFVRCVYDESSDSFRNVFRRLSGDASVFDSLIGWLTENGFEYSAGFELNGVGNMENSGVSYMKNIEGGVSDGGFNPYNHTHIGFRAEFNALENPPNKFSLSIQKPREILPLFGELPETVRQFIVEHHAKCNKCGYCSQRSKGKSKPFTVVGNHGGKNYPFCPINHIYTYRWDALTDELARGLTAYLDYLQNSKIFAL